jgi:hypothetical protein
MERDAINEMGTCVGPTWRRGGWPLLYSRGGSNVASDTTGDYVISIHVYGLQVGSGHGSTSWGGLGP